ncbi:amidohydrolase family-domain-containing protein [Zopfochytrium polystomum]|nr:amidohydrolase family-domain-containing protein [Zopfochytrium polystomum]
MASPAATDSNSAPSPTATTIFTNGRFFISADSFKRTTTATTGSPGSVHPEPAPQASFADCMITTDSKIAFVGPTDHPAVAGALAAGASTVDLGGRIVLPGFVDGHMHLMLMGQFLKAVDLGKCKNLDGIRSTIRTWAAAHPAAERIVCRGWMHSMTDGAALASMLEDLDARPIYVSAKDLHSTWCSWAALAELGVDAATPEVPGGSIARDAGGNPTGLLSEAANINLVWPHLARIATLDERIERLEAAFAEYTASGYTGLVDMAMDETAWEAVQALLKRRAARGDPPPPCRLAAHWLVAPKGTDAAAEAAHFAQVDRAAALRDQFNLTTSPACRIAGIKLICDGVIDACTAALSEPYTSAPHTSGGDPLWPRAALLPVVRRAAQHGLQIALHAIGDAAITTAIDVLEETAAAASAGGTHAPPHRPRIEHLELASARDAARLGALGITASIQPAHADPWVLRAWPALLGASRCGRAFAYGEFHACGAPLALGSDAPTAPHGVWGAWHTAVTRASAREPAYAVRVNERFRLDVATVAAAQTAGAAYSCCLDGVAGRLERGLSADFVVVDLEWAADSVARGRVLETWFEGRKVFDAAAAGGQPV